jgi:hypothetical protein
MGMKLRRPAVAEQHHGRSFEEDGDHAVVGTELVDDALVEVVRVAHER